MRKMVTLAVCAALTISAAACTGNDAKKAETEVKRTEAQKTESEKESETVQIPNPFVTFNTLKEAAEYAGFDFTAPESIDGYEVDEINAIEGDFAQIIFKKSNGDEVRFRKGAGTEDISGDNTKYAEEKTIEVDGNTVTLKGADKSYRLAVWTSGDYSYAVYAPGISEADITAYVSQVK